MMEALLLLTLAMPPPPQNYECFASTLDSQSTSFTSPSDSAKVHTKRCIAMDRRLNSARLEVSPSISDSIWSSSSRVNSGTSKYTPQVLEDDVAMPPPLVQSSDLPAGIGRSVTLNAPGALHSPDAIRAVILRAEALSALQWSVSLEPSDRRHSAGFERVLPVLHAMPPPLPLPALQSGPHLDAHAAALGATRNQNAFAIFEVNRIAAAGTLAGRDDLTSVGNFGGVVSPHAPEYTAPIADAVGTIGRYVPEPVGMSGNWQTAGSDSVGRKAEFFVSHPMMAATEPDNVHRPAVVFVMRVGDGAAAFPTRFLDQLPASHGTRDSLTYSIAFPVSSTFQLPNVRLGVGVLMSSCSICTANAAESTLAGVHLGENSLEWVATAFTGTINECLTHKKEVADGRDFYPAQGYSSALLFGLKPASRFAAPYDHQRFNINAASAAVDSIPLQDDADDKTSRLDLGLGVISLSAAMIATGLTSSCLAAKTCHETVGLTRWAFDRGPVWGVLGRAGVSGLVHYGVARWIPKGRWRTATLGVLAAINVTNAVLDIRTLTKIEQDAGR